MDTEPGPTDDGSHDVPDVADEPVRAPSTDALTRLEAELAALEAELAALEAHDGGRD